MRGFLKGQCGYFSICCLPLQSHPTSETHMNKIIAFLIIIILTSCNDKKVSKATNLKTQVSKTSSINRDRLDYYFGEYEIKPSMVVNNIDGNQTEVHLSKHIIKWFNTDDETKIQIDNDLFTLKDKVTLNHVWGNEDNVDFANNWDEMKLYKINDRDLIGIRMSFEPCTGLGCNINYFLIYDFQTRTKNFFGTFRTDNKLALYNFNNDKKLDYLAKTFSGDAQGLTPMEFIDELYSMENNGHFVKQINSNGQTFQIKQTTFPNDTAKAETFEQRWLTEIK